MFLEIATGSDGSVAGGEESDLSEWQRSAADAAAVSARKMPGTATGKEGFISYRIDALHLYIALTIWSIYRVA